METKPPWKGDAEMSTKLAARIIPALLIAFGVSASDKNGLGDGVIHGTNLKVNGHTLNKAANRAENLHKVPLQRKVEKTDLDAVEFEEVPLDAALKALRKQIAESGGPKVNFFVKKATPQQRKEKISLDLERVPASTAIRYVCMAAGMTYKYDEFAVVLEPAPPGYKW
jgi:hypothetical protein